jgi:hypothetical protein
MADGFPYALPPVRLEKSGVATVNINNALAAAPSTLARHISQSGSVTLQYRYDWAGAILESVSILDTVRSLQFQSRFVYPDAPLLPSVQGQFPAGNAGPQMIEGMWWKYSPVTNVYLSVANPTDTHREADVTAFDDRHHNLGTRHFSLSPHASVLAVLDPLLNAAGRKGVGGLEITFIGEPDTVLFSGGIEDDSVGYSAALTMSMAMMPGMYGAPASAASCTVASAGLMLGAPDPMEGFPRSVVFTLFGFARNTTDTAITMHGLANYMDKDRPHSIALPDVPLAPGEARDLNLDRAVVVPFKNGDVNVSYTYGASCGAVLMNTGRLLPACDVSNQISTAGYEASGTSNMKFMMNGALTVGTHDGATIEMAEEAGAENFFLFGLTAEQVAGSRGWYNPHWHYEHEPETHAALDLIFSDHFSRKEPGIFGPLRDALLTRGDYYMHLADLTSYCQAHQRLADVYADPYDWARKAILNVAGSGKFSSDRAINEYARDIWGAKPCPVVCSPD